MIDFSKRIYIFISAIPFINILLWIFIVFFLIKNNMIKDKIVSVILGSTILSLLIFMLPQMILNAFDISLKIREILNFVNIIATIFVIDMHLIQIAKPH